MLYVKVLIGEFNVMSNEENCIYLINNCSKELSIYIEKVWYKRNGILYKYINKRSLPYIVMHVHLTFIRRKVVHKPLGK